MGLDTLWLMGMVVSHNVRYIIKLTTKQPPAGSEDDDDDDDE